MSIALRRGGYLFSSGVSRGIESPPLPLASLFQYFIILMDDCLEDPAEAGKCQIQYCYIEDKVRLLTSRMFLHLPDLIAPPFDISIV